MPESIMTAVLIHGAWAGGWVWEAITPYLEDQGFRVMAPDLPGCGKRLGNPAEASLDQCVAELEEMLQQVEGPLLLVGHSGGGAVATQLAEAISERVVGVAFLAGMMLPSGTGFGEIVRDMLAQHPEASGIGPFLTWEDGGRVSRVPADAIRQIFLQDVSDSIAAKAIPRFTSQAERSRQDPADKIPPSGLPAAEGGVGDVGREGHRQAAAAERQRGGRGGEGGAAAVRRPGLPVGRHHLQ